MSKVAARFTLADLTRAIRASKEQGAEAVEIKPDGTIKIKLVDKDEPKESKPEKFRDFKL
jgi:hypothetical protein